MKFIVSIIIISLTSCVSNKPKCQYQCPEALARMQGIPDPVDHDCPEAGHGPCPICVDTQLAFNK